MTRLQVDADAVRDLRRALGPVPWFVLEELLLTEGERDASGGLLVRVGFRALAEAVSLKQDTVARALAALTRAALVEPQPQTSAVGGRFGSGGYRVRPVDGIERLDTRPDLAHAASPSPSPTRPPASPAARRRPKPVPAADQLSLLPADLDHDLTHDPEPTDALAPGVPPPVPGPVRDREHDGSPEGEPC